MNKEDYKDVYVFIEQRDGKVQPVAFELLGKARELADALGISFQAVSNWERGASMPDISKLPELAEIFGVTIDEVLGKNNPAIVQLAHGETIDTRAATPEEIEEAAMIAKPSQLEKTVADNFDSLTDAAASASSPRPRCSRAWRRTRARPAQRFPTSRTQSTTAPPRSCCPARPLSASTR